MGFKLKTRALRSSEQVITDAGTGQQFLIKRTRKKKSKANDGTLNARFGDI